jgi:hypothetical protein
MRIGALVDNRPMIEKRVRNRWAKDAALLMEIGRHLEPQNLEVKVTLPRQLVVQAIAKWNRDDPWFRLKRETTAQKRTRHRAGGTGLIGLRLSQQQIGKGKVVAVKLPANLIGDALRSHWDDD